MTGGVVALFFLLLFVGLMILFTRRVINGNLPQLRRIQAFERLKELTGQVVEAGRPLHLSLGVGGIANETTADTLAGLAVLDYLAGKAATVGMAHTVSMADPAVLLFARNKLEAIYSNNPDKGKEACQNLHWIAPQPGAYSAGVMSLLDIDQVEANVMVGNFGDEYLLMGETAARRKINYVGGSSVPSTLPFIYATADETLLGEEIYVAGAYLNEYPSHIGSLLTQDMMRWLIAIFIIGGVIFTSLLN